MRNGIGPAGQSKNLHSLFIVSSSGMTVVPFLAREMVSIDKPVASATSLSFSSRPSSSSFCVHNVNSMLRIATLKASYGILCTSEKLSLDKKSKAWYSVYTHAFDGKTNQIPQSSPNRETKNPAQYHQQRGAVGDEPGFNFPKGSAPKASVRLLTGRLIALKGDRPMSTTTNILTQPRHTRNTQSDTIEDSQTIIVLSNGDFVIVPEGADPDWLRRYHENLIYRAANPRPKRKRRRSEGKASKKVNYAAAVVGREIAWNVAGQQRKLVMA